MVMCLSVLGILISYTIEACNGCDPSGQNFMNNMQSYGEYNPTMGRGNMSGIGGGMVGFGGMGGGTGTNYEGFPRTVGMMNPIGNFGAASPLAGAAYGSNVYGIMTILEKVIYMAQVFPQELGAQRRE